MSEIEDQAEITMDMERITQWSSLSRTVDFRLKNHQFILAISIVSGAVGLTHGLFARQLSPVQALILGINFGIAAFLSWVLSRELDPDHPNSGLIAPLLLIPALLVLEQPSILAGFWIVTLLRVLNRTTGLPTKPLDSLGIVLLSLWAGYTIHPVALLLTGLALLIDRWLPEAHPYNVILGALISLLALGYIFVFGIEVNPPADLNLIIGVSIAGFFYLLAVLLQEEPLGQCDYVDRRVSVRRVRIGQIAALTIALIFVLLLGQRGIVILMPLWAAMIGLAGFEFAQKLS